MINPSHDKSGQHINTLAGKPGRNILASEMESESVRHQAATNEIIRLEKSNSRLFSKYLRTNSELVSLVSRLCLDSQESCPAEQNRWRFLQVKSDNYSDRIKQNLLDIEVQQAKFRQEK